MGCEPESPIFCGLIPEKVGSPGGLETAGRSGREKLAFLGEMRRECIYMVRNNHDFDVPEHPVIFAMERYGEYPWPRDSLQLTADSGHVHEGKTSLGTNFTSKLNFPSAPP